MNNSTGDFIDYEEATLDPGWSFIVGSLIACILLNASLPCLVSLGSRYERRRNETNNKSSEESTDGGRDGSSKVVLVGMGRVLDSIEESKPADPTKNVQTKNQDKATTLQISPMMEKFKSDLRVKKEEIEEKSYTTADTAHDGMSSLVTSCFGGGGGGSGSVVDWFCGLADSVCLHPQSVCSRFCFNLLYFLFIARN
jgi:hypothetical protein